MLADDQALLGLALGEAGFVDAMRPDTVYVSMSTAEALTLAEHNQLADESRTPAPLAGVAHDHLVEGIARCRGEWDLAAMVEVVREQAGLR